MSRTNSMRALRRIVAAAWRVDGDTASVPPERARRRMLAAGVASAALAGVSGLPRLARAAPLRGGVAIVGAGLAGLACAYQLALTGIRANVYEGASRAGGRCWSLRDFFPGQVAELGGELIDTTHTTMRGFANAFSLTLETVTASPGEVTYYFSGQHYSEVQVVDEFRAFVPRMREDLRRLGKPTATKFSAYDAMIDRMSLAEYLDTRGASGLIRAVIDIAYNIEFGRDIGEQSALAFLLYIHADRRSKFAPFGVFSDERFHIVEGNDAVVQGLARAIPGEPAFDHRLVAARRLTDGRIALTFDGPGGSVVSEYDAVVLALPFSMLREVALDASLALPAWKRFAIERLIYGTNAKMMIGFDGRPWYALHTSNGASYSDLPNHQATWETNPTRANAARAILTDYSSAARGARLNPAQAQVEAGRFLTDLDKMWPGAKARASRTAAGYRVQVRNWSREPWVKGSYTCNQPGYFTTIADNEAAPVGNLFFCGEHTSSFYEAQGFMEGAAASGLRAAKEVAALLRVPR